MSTHNICFHGEIRNYSFNLYLDTLVWRYVLTALQLSVIVQISAVLSLGLCTGACRLDFIVDA